MWNPRGSTMKHERTVSAVSLCTFCLDVARDVLKMNQEPHQRDKCCQEGSLPVACSFAGAFFLHHEVLLVVTVGIKVWSFTATHFDVVYYCSQNL